MKTLLTHFFCNLLHRIIFGDIFIQEFSFGKLLWVSGGYAPIFTKLQVGDLTIYYNIKKKGDPFVLRNIWTAPYINANRCTCSQSFANCQMKLLCLFTTLYVQIVIFDNTVPHNLRSFLAANSTQNYFLIARMLIFFVTFATKVTYSTFYDKMRQFLI